MTSVRLTVGPRASPEAAVTFSDLNRPRRMTRWRRGRFYKNTTIPIAVYLPLRGSGEGSIKIRTVRNS